MDKAFEALKELIIAFQEKPWLTTIFILILGAAVGTSIYLFVHQPKSVPEGSQIIQSIGNDNKNSNTK